MKKKLKKPKKKWIKYSFRKYLKEYPGWFNQEKKELLKLLPNSKIEHIGSTAVPGLGGKGIIDIAILTSKRFLKTAKKKISNYGYEQWPVKKKRKFFSFARYHKLKENPKEVFHIHITSDKDVFETMLAFRDYLLKNPKVSKEYAKLKKKAVRLCKNQYKPYIALKNPFIKSAIKKAKKAGIDEIKALIFDIGGVLHIGDEKSHEEVYQALKIPRKDYFKKIGLVWEKLVIGKIDDENGLNEMAKRLCVSKERLRQIWKRGIRKRFILNKPLLSLIKNLKKNYKTAILSDQWFLPYKILITKQVSSAFDIEVFSHQLGIRKPSKEIYTKTLSKLNLSPSQCVFIDNQSWNLVPAKKLGMKTILFKNNKQLIQDLNKLGVEVK